MSNDLKYLPTDVYLFGVDFPNVGDAQNPRYKALNIEKDLTSLEELKNIRPMSRLPIAINLGEESAALWATDDLGRLHVLGDSTQKNQKTNINQVLVLRSPVHELAQKTYKLSFPEWSMLTELAIGAQSKARPIKKACADLVSILEKLKGYDGEQTLNSLEKKVEYAVAEVKRSQLAPKYEAGTQALPDEQVTYNKWYDSVPEDESIRGFIVPTFSFLAVVFSTQEYADAIVKVTRFDEESGQHLNLQDEEIITQAQLDRNSDSHRPIALFPLASEVFTDGMYTIEVVFDVDLIDEIPEFAQNATNVTKEYDEFGDATRVSYELREYITLSQTTPFGKIAVVAGDMISLEESLIYQFPTQFKALQAFRMGELENLENSGTTASMSAALWEIGTKVTPSLVNAGINIHQNPSSKHDVVGSLANTFWGQVDKGALPPAMISALEFSFGVSATAAAYQTLQDLRQAASESERAAQVGLKALLKEKGFDKSKFFTKVIEPARNGNAHVVAGSAARTWLTGNGSVKSFLSPFAGAGLNAINTFYEIKAITDKSEQLRLAEEKAKLRKSYFEQVSRDYLNWVPVWKESLKSGELLLKQIIDKLGDNVTFTDSIPNDVAEDSAMFVKDHKGAGLRLVFPFDNNQVQAPHLSYLAAVDKELSKIPNAVVEIEGHACQNGDSEYNQNLSQQRAQHVAEFFSSVSDIRFFGERRPIVEVPNNEIKRENAQLNINRRVEVRIYLQEFAARIPPSRLGFKAMEQARLAQLDANLGEEAIAKELKLAIFEMIVGMACYVPIIGQAARGFFVVKEGGKMLMSGAQLLDSVLFDYYLSSYNEARKSISAIEQLSHETTEIIDSLAEIDTQLTELYFTSSDALVEHLGKATGAKELIKRYQRRALAINGLVLLIQRACSEGEQEFTKQWRILAIDEYIQRYIETDGWILNTELKENLCNLWLQELMRREGHKQLIESYGEEIAEQIITRNKANYIAPKRKDVSGAFNVAFPVQDKLYNRDQQRGLVEFATQFNVESKKLSEEDLGFVRLLVSEPHDNSKWVTFDEWEKARLKANKKVRLSPFHRLKWQMVLGKQSLKQMTSNVFQCEMSYQRTDGLLNTSGPKFNLMFKPMKHEEFSVDPKGELAEFFEAEKVDSKVLIGCEFEPYFYFGDDVFSGVKPLIAKHDLVDYSGYLSKVALGPIFGQVIKIDSQQDVLKEYVNSGGFKNMTYEFTLSGSNYKLPVRVDKTVGRFITSPRQIPVGVDTNHNHTLSAKSGFIANGNSVSEKDLLSLDFVLHSKVHKGPTKPVIDNIKHSAIAVNYGNKRQFMNEDSMFTTADELKGFDWTSNKSFAMEVMLIGGKHRKESYEGQNLEWQSVPVSLKLSTTFDNEAVFGSETTAGPEYLSNLTYIGILKKDGSKWTLDDSDVINKNIDADFVSEALSNIDMDEDFDGKVVYVSRFEFAFKALNGQEIKGLRPFGPVVSTSGRFQEAVLKVSSLVQRNTAEKTPFKLGSFEMSLGRQYKNVDELSYFSDCEDPSYKVDKDMYINWAKLKPAERTERLVTWIRDPYLATIIEASILNK
ncbi:cell envelope biogenesis protein OmpA [Vibrio sp. 10N.222.52.B12]|uniref:OmpA family protein n=1 Tax=Vibrio sp. 10N.222.52.B12 TaxID=1880840 RepID=UPI000C820E80|nr:OmpA family protein [Vibrio sp. 10N.222.52.B12]PMO47401.1 cell envelope biogenesis protein OmpA [Vibrio sp. 10N.222.52.B12]